MGKPPPRPPSPFRGERNHNQQVVPERYLSLCEESGWQFGTTAKIGSFAPPGLEGFCVVPLPTAHAVGYDLPPLRGWRTIVRNENFVNEPITHRAKPVQRPPAGRSGCQEPAEAVRLPR